MFPFYLTGIGSTYPEYHIVRSEGLTSHQFLFTAEGSGLLKIDGNSYIQTSGSIFYLAPHTPHEYYSENDNWKTCWVVFRGDHLSEIMSDLGFGSFAVKDKCVSDNLVRIYEQLLAAAADPVYGGRRCSVLVYKFILEAREAMLSDCSKNVAIEHISGAVAFMDEHLSEDIPLEKLAEISGVSLQHFCRLFKAAMGMRPMEYLARRRVAKAKLLLCNREFSIAEIGAECGYSDPTYFGMVFKKYEGISPREYRKIGDPMEL